MNIGIIGLGMMGGSLAKGIRRNRADVIFGSDACEEVVLRAKLLDLIDETIDEDNLKLLDMVFVCAGLNETKEIIDEVTPKLKEGAILADITGVKKTIVPLLKQKAENYPHVEFVSLHPMAGREFSGLKHSTVNLYENAYVLFIPINISLPGLKKVKTLFQNMKIAGAKVTNPADHDKIIAFTSQLPHILSNAYVKNPIALQSLGFAAGSFRDFTRVAKISSKMWTPLLMENKEELLNAIGVFKKNLEVLESVLIEEDYEQLAKELDKGNNLKQLVDKQIWED